MSIQHIIAIAVAAATLSSVGCIDADRKRESATELAPANKPVLTSTLTPTKAPPAPVAVPEPVVEPKVAAEKPEVVAEKPKASPVLIEPITESIDGVTLQRFITTSQIEKREPVDPTSVFGPTHEKVYAFVEVSNESESDKRLFVHFIGPNEKVTGGIELEIPASVPRWRTWAYTRHFDAPGLWRVEIRDEEGSLLGALPFEVDAAF
jgi:hypothetical protein